MPPWGADPTVGKFANDLSLQQAEIATIAAWVDAGAPEGNSAELPQAPKFAEGLVDRQAGSRSSRCCKPFKVPADGTVPYIYITIPTNLKEDIWIRGVELKPTDRRVVHHIISDLVEGNGKPVDPTPKLRAIARARKSAAASAGSCPAGSTAVSKRASRARFRRAPTSSCRCTTRRSDSR